MNAYVDIFICCKHLITLTFLEGTIDCSLCTQCNGTDNWIYLFYFFFHYLVCLPDGICGKATSSTASQHFNTCKITDGIKAKKNKAPVNFHLKAGGSPSWVRCIFGCISAVKPILVDTVLFGMDLYVNNMYVQAQREQWAERCFPETPCPLFQNSLFKNHPLAHAYSSPHLITIHPWRCGSRCRR